MKTWTLALLATLFLLVAGGSGVACGGETVPDEAPVDAGPPEAGREAGPPPCSAGESVSCTCADGKTGKALCQDSGKPGTCACGSTTLDEHTVISKSNRSQIEVETHLAAAPDGALCSVWISLGNAGSEIGYTFSRDGGATWTPPKVTGDDDGRESSDPVVAADTQGNFYVTWIAFRRGAMDVSDFVLYVAKASAGQNSFATPVAADSFPSGDKPWITVTAAGTILVTVQEDVGGVPTLVALRSSDGGGTWTKSTIFSSTGGDANFIVPCAPKSGSRVWSTHLAVTGSGTLAQQLHWSDDDGVTWPAANTKVYGTNSAITPATCVAQGSDVWIGYGRWTTQPANEESPLDEYHVMHTKDGVTLDDVVASSAMPKQENLGSLALEDATGEMALTYYGGDSDNAAGAVYSVRSSDAGKTWSKAVAVSAPLQFTSDRATQKWLGDYMGSVLRGGKLYVTYGENADSFTHIAFSKSP